MGHTLAPAPQISEENLEKLRAQLPPGTEIWLSKGELLTGGGTAMVELLPSGDVLKRPKDDSHPVIAADHLRNMRIEAEIYEALGEHSRLAKFKGFDPDEAEILMEYLPNGRLDRYIESHKETSLEQRLRWVDQAIESLEMLHSFDVIHCDFGPHNLLLDKNLDLRITDFAGSSFKGSRPWVAGSDGYWLPDAKPEGYPNKGIWMTHGHDLFALGSTMYCIFTGHAPFEDLEGEAKNEKFRNAQFPDTAHVPCNDIIQGCWRQSLHSIWKVRQEFEDYLATKRARGE